MNRVWYTSNRGYEAMSAQAIIGTLESVIPQTSSEVSKRKAGRPRKQVANAPVSSNDSVKEVNNMTKRITNSVFDLQAFDDIKLVKDVEVPEKVGSVEEAVKLLDHNQEKLMEIINEGLQAVAIEAARKDLTGWKVENDEGEPGEDYVGTPVDEKKGKLINAAVLAFAKMQGYHKDLSREEKRKKKDAAEDFLRNNPAIIASLQTI
jgi:hypothetical protein